MAAILRLPCINLPISLFSKKAQQICVVPRRLKRPETIRWKRIARTRIKRSRKEARAQEAEEKQQLMSKIKVEFQMQSLATRGFLRNLKPYVPPNDVEGRILNLGHTLFTGANHNDLQEVKLDDPLLKYKFLTSCLKEFNHEVTSSQLHKMRTIGDVIKYYQEPIQSTTPFENLVNSELPPNLHVLPNYVRFDPETDTKFNGISAFPQRSTIVTGLKAKKLYKGFDAQPLATKLKLITK